jgi:hypothetical protein
VKLRRMGAVDGDVENPVTDHGFGAAPVSHSFASCFRA